MGICPSIALICIAGTPRKFKEDQSLLVPGAVETKRVQKDKTKRREEENKSHVSWLLTYHCLHYTRKLLLNLDGEKNQL